MKFEVNKKRDHVEIRVFGEGGKVTVYLCEDEQASLFKLASLLYTTEDPKEAKRSILVGEFEKPKKKTRKKKSLEDQAKKALEELLKKGFEKVGDLVPDPAQNPLIGQPYMPKIYGTGTSGGFVPSSTTGGLVMGGDCNGFSISGTSDNAVTFTSSATNLMFTEETVGVDDDGVMTVKVSCSTVEK